ncbi:Protein of unknown function [Gryllus bimaculatus]|nr:Protein of unknown function [Gryllus bimaculatus]
MSRKELLARPLTKHQKESFRQRRDDIPALYEDLTQDSQPSFSDSQDSFQMMAANPVIDNDATSMGECVSIPRDTSFQSKENIPLKKLLTDSSDDASRKTGNIKNVKCLKTVVSPKYTDHYTGKSEALIVKSPKSSQQSQNEVEVIDISPNSQKTSPVNKLTFKADVGRPTNAPIVTNVKENLGSEAKKVKSEAFHAMPHILKTKFRRQSPASTHHPIKVCISKLQTDSPEVKRIVLKLPIGSQINSVRESKQTHVKKINDLIKNMQNFSSPKTSTCDENVCASSHIEQDTSNKLDKSIKSISRENAADTLTSTKNGEASDNCQKSPAVKEENLNLISCQRVVTSKEHSDPNIKSSERDRDETTEVTSECIEQNPEKQMENGSKVLPPNNQVVSPAKVILKRLEINDVNNYTCRALLFKDQEQSSSEIFNKERLVKLSSESGNNELKASKLDLKPSSNLFNSDKDLLSEKLISTSSEEVGKLEKESREQQSVEVFVPKEVISKSCVSQTQDSESTSHAEQHTKTKIPTPFYQTRPKAIKTYHFTRSYDKKRLSKKIEQNQMSNSPKENVMAENVLSQKKSDAAEIVNQRQLKTLIHVQNYQNSLSSSHEASNKLDFESPTSTAKNSKYNAVDKTKEDKLEVNCSRIINIPAEIENVHADSQLVNHIQNSCSKLSDERAGGKSNQNKLNDSEISVCGPETRQQQSIDGGELSTTSPKTSPNKHEPPSLVEDTCAKEVQKREYMEIRTECLPEVDKPNKMEQVIGDCSNQESREKMLDAKSNSSKSITHYFPIIPVPESSTPSHVNIKDKSLTSKSSNSVISESVGGGQIMMEQLQTSVSEMPRKKLDEHNNDLSKKISSTVPDTSCREVSSQISCDKGEYVRSLSLMPQNANSAVQPKAHKISTRSDWARRFGCRLETDIPKNNDDCFEKNSDENMNFSNNLTADVLDYEDVVESSQPKKVVFKDCCIALPKLSITLGSILSGVEGDLTVSEEISSGLFRVMDKSCEKGNDAQIESADNVEKSEELETPIYETSDEIPENTASMNPDTMQQVSVVENLPVEIEQSDASVRNDHGGVDSCESPDRIQLLENKEKDITKCSESYDEKPKDTEIIDLTFDESNEREYMDMKPNELQDVLIETENPLSVSEELDQDKKRKRKRNDKICKTYSKKRRIMQLYSNNESNEGTEESSTENANLDGISTDVIECEPISHNNEETEKSSPSKFSVGANLLNGSPMKIKRSKHLVRSEDSSSPSRKHMSGRAAHLVDLALTKKSIHANIDLPTPSTSSEVELEESNHDVIFSFNAEGEEEKSPWVRSSPQAEASPGKTNLKRKHSVDNGETPSRKSVRFSDPEVTRKLHFQKIESPEKTTFRIVRTKKGKLYVQKNTSNTKDRIRRVDRSTEPKPVWPNLKDCTSPVSDVTDQLAVTGDCKDMLISSLDSRHIYTIGELCSLTESDIDELPVKAPKIIVFKLVMQAYEDRMKNLQSYKAIRQQRLQQENCSGNITSTDLKNHLSSMSRDAIVDLLKESLSETDLKEVAANFNTTVLASSSTSIGVSTELETEDKASSTDDSILQQLDYFLPEALKKQDEQSGQKKILLHVLQMLLHHCGVSHTFEEFWEVVSNSDFEPPKGNVNAVNQCFKFLQYLCTGSALPLERAREFYQDSIRQFGVQSVLSEILKCGESEHKSTVFLKDVMNCIKEKLCANEESAAEVFQCLITDSSIPLAIEHCTAKQLVPHVTNKFGDLTVLDTVLTGSTMTREKALDSLKKYLSSEDVDEKKWMDTIFELINLNGIAKDKRNLMLTLLNSAIDLVRYK